MHDLPDFAMVLLDAAGFVRTWNEGAARIYGVAEREAVGSHCSRFYSPEEAASGKPRRDLEIARTRSRFEEESVRLRRDGSLCRAQVVIVPLSSAGALRGYATMVRELTRIRPACPHRVLLVGVAAESCELLADGLHLAGHEVSLAADGHAALAVLDRFEPDVVVLDLGLPGLDAWEVARRIRARSPAPRRPRILGVTDGDPDEARERSEHAGIERQFVQPVELLRLLDHLGAMPVRAMRHHLT